MDRILNYMEGEYYRSCPFLQEWVFFNDFCLKTCCELDDPNLRPIPTPTVSLCEDKISIMVKEYIQMRKDLIDTLRAGSPCMCDGCKDLYEGWWSKEKKIKKLVIGFSYRCNLCCIYCIQSPGRDRYKNISEIEKKFSEMFVMLVRLLEETGLVDSEMEIQWAGGEFSINPERKKLMEIMGKYSVNIATNGVIYDSDISKLIARSNSGINVSLDAGTRETYKKVKGRDVFSQVTETLRRYHNEGGHMTLKYIVLKENCFKEDFDGFLDLCEELQPECVQINRDQLLTSTEFVPGSQILEGMIYLGGEAKKRGLNYYIFHNLVPEIMNYVNERILKY